MSTTTSQTNNTSLSPKFGSIDTWCLLSGMGRRATYDALGHGNLKAVKAGTRTLINIEKGLAWLESLPAAQIRPQKPRKAVA
jgi:hypothetical protein